MMNVPDDAAEPAPRLLSRLLRVELEKGAPLFGNDVGFEPGEHDVPASRPALDGGAVTVDTAAAGPLAQSELKTWLIDTLGAKRGVLCGLPRLPEGKGLSQRPAERILALDRKAVSGYAWWWLWHMRRTIFSRRDSYTARGDTGLSVYRLGGEPNRAFDWFPGGATYGIEPGVIDGFLHFGLTMSVREFDATPMEPRLELQVQHAAILCYSQLDAATHGVAPAVFATFLVHDLDQFTTVQDVLTLPANAVSFATSRCKEVATGRRVAGIVTITQLHTFRMSDMLRAYIEMGAAENVVRARAEVMAATVALAGKIKQLAELKVLKLNMSADNVVFCPELVETEGDDWELRGFGFRSADFDSVKGKPFLWDFDSRMCKRLTGQDGYDTNASFVMMVLVLLASVRAQFGDLAFSAMLEALLQSTDFLRAYERAKDKADSFTAMVGQSFQHGRLERDALPSAMLLEAAQDFRTAVLNPSGVGQLVDGGRPLFRGLLQLLLGTRRFVPADLVGGDELPAVMEARRRARARWHTAMRGAHIRVPVAA